VGRLGLVSTVCVVAASVAATATGRVPTTQTFTPKGLGLSFAMPSDWAGSSGGPSGLRFSVAAPGRVANLSVYTGPTASSLAVLKPRLVTLVRGEFAGSDPHTSLTQRTTMVGSSVPALVLTVRYHGVWTTKVGRITHVMYLFVRGGTLYDFDFSAVDPWTQKELPIFAASARSIEFPPSA